MEVRGWAEDRSVRGSPGEVELEWVLAPVLLVVLWPQVHLQILVGAQLVND